MSPSFEQATATAVNASSERKKGGAFIALQHLLPQHLLSRLVGTLAASESAMIRDGFIRFFLNRYDIDLGEAERSNAGDYKSFNDFFTRALKPGARTIDSAADSIVCPADGSISQIGRIDAGRIFQAKGFDFTTQELLGGDAQRAAPFANGRFVTVYLSPRDYHRVHMPFAGTLKEMVYVPGDLFSVNDHTANSVDRLFARNERVVALFDTEKGPMAVVMVGAMIVASIATAWAGVVTPPRRELTVTPYDDAAINLAKGAEMGRFLLGSTAIVLLPDGAMEWSETLQAGDSVRMGQRISC